MEWSKIKNIIIIILLTVNAFLLISVADREWKSAQYQEEARLGAVEVLRSNRIEMDEKSLPPETGLLPMTAERDREGEADLAGALLTNAVKTGDRGRDTYEGDKGSAWFRLDGSFGFTFAAGAYPLDGADPTKHAQTLLSGAGYLCEVVETGAADEETGTTYVRVRQTWEDTPLFNCTARLLYRNGELVSIDEGTRLIGTPVAAGGADTLNVAAVLLRFLSGVRDGGHVCREVLSLTAGYEVTPETSGQARLSLVWQVMTDAGPFQVDGVTGEVKQA